MDSHQSNVTKDVGVAITASSISQRNFSTFFKLHSISITFLMSNKITIILNVPFALRAHVTPRTRATLPNIEHTNWW